MYLLTYLERLDKFDQLLQKKQTGPPKEIAKNLNISVRAFHEFKDQLIYEFGFPIAYCRKRSTYYYVEQGTVNWGFISK